MKKIFFLVLLLTTPGWAGNTQVYSFSKAKKLLLDVVYAGHDETFYCKGHFDLKNNIVLPEGFKTPNHEKRAHKLEWEHVVPAENFGRAFAEWRDGHPNCIDSKGKPFKGRKCAEKMNKDFQLMQADMYNLYPAIGAVNAIRSNFNYAELPTAEITFGSCPMKIEGKKVEPPEYTKGTIARTYLYFEEEYPSYRMSDSQKKMFEAWDKAHPVDAWECERARRIEKLQGNSNPFVKELCEKEGL
ncbi:MAG: endonuclease [Alphaproteobacteria bacterium]|nr:endonuclease [Alphaproteobacteria bacterium]